MSDLIRRCWPYGAYGVLHGFSYNALSVVERLGVWHWWVTLLGGVALLVYVEDFR